MEANRKCPNCGSEKVQLSYISKNHGCLWFLLFGLFYVIWVMIKWIIGLIILICFDWWMAIIKESQEKGVVWESKKWFSGKTRVYYCHDCGYNFQE